MKHILIPFLAAAATFLAALRAEGQVDSNLLRREWQPENHWADTFDKPLLIFPSKAGPGEDTTEIFHWDSYGRIKTDSTDRDPAFWIGYRLLTMGVTSTVPAIPRGFYDLGLAVAGKLGSLGPGWSLEASAGLGTANDGSFSNLEAIYPAVTVLSVHEISPTESLQLGIAYDGSRALAPALPIPVVEYEARPDPSLRLRVGFPHLEAEVAPWTGLFLRVIAEYPANARLEAEGVLGSGLSVFAESCRRLDAFHLRDAGRERIFYLLNTAEGGLRFRSSWIDVSLSGGWAFGQEFFTGYDLRERSVVTEPDNGPFVALTVQGTF